MSSSDAAESRAGPYAPTWHSVKLPPDLALILRRLAYETGKSKQELLLAAVQSAYGEKEQ